MKEEMLNLAEERQGSVETQKEQLFHVLPRNYNLQYDASKSRQ